MFQRPIQTFFSILLLGLFSLQLRAAAVRHSEPLNREWSFYLGDAEGAAQPNYDDASWQQIGLPHSFSIPYFQSSHFYTGYGWYRHELSLTKADVKQRLSLEFDGVFQEAEVYVNGQLAGSHTGGYTAFNIDFSHLAQVGRNLIAVRVNNLWRPVVAPRGGEHVFSGGIYRSVRLVKTSAKARIAWKGVAITTPGLEQSQGQTADVQLAVTLCGSGALRVMAHILDAAGTVVGSAEAIARPETGGTYSLCISDLRAPHLWSPDTPYLYSARVRLYDGSKLLDEVTETFGFRWFRWSKDEGFFLNGRHYYFRGANVHQDQAGWGDAVTEAAARRDVRMVREAGFDMIRGSHYPHSDAFVDECDRQGILFWSEAPFWATAGTKADGSWTASGYPVLAADTAAFEASALQQLEEMICQQRNHPSVFVWSMCNEPFFSDERAMAGVHRLLRRMVARSHQLDPTRPAAIGGAQRPLGAQRIDLIGDIAGYNGDGATIPDFQHPDVPNVVTEYGTVASDRPGQYIPNWGDLARDEGWRGRPWRGGQAIWCCFDHGSIFGESMGKMGIVDYFRLPKRSWYWYRNAYRQVPPPEWPTEGTPARLGLVASSTTGIRADGTDDTQLIVSVLDADGRQLSNNATVTLTIVDGPGQFPTGRSITFAPGTDIRMDEGMAAIALRAYYAGTTHVVATSPGLQSDTLCLQFTHAPKWQPGKTYEVESRPYVRYEQPVVQEETYGVNSPTFASSAAPGHSPGHAADGQAATYWQPADAAGGSAGAEGPWWTLDVERRLSLSAVSISFVESVAQAIVEVSADAAQWTTIQQLNHVRDVRFTLPTPVAARFIRVRFPQGTHPKITDVQVRGIIKPNL